jgi:hypothetical protein
MYDESEHTQVAGNAVAVVGGAGVTATVEWLPEFSDRSFEVVPEGHKLILTDVIYNPQLDVTAPHRVNIAERWPDGAHRIIIQCFIPPEATQQIHFHTGHVIEPEKTVIVFTDLSLPEGEHISVDLNGYLARLDHED